MASRRMRYLTLLLASGAILSAQTTGSLQGRVVDPKGRPVVGATVSVSGAGIQGGRSTTTDESGTYRIGLLPPGLCTITATKEGLNAAKAQIQVGLDRTATVDLTLKSIATATVEVTDANATVDLKATTAGSNYTSEAILKLPTTRDFANVALLAPGVSQDNAGFKVYGSSGAENNFVVDGINTTNVEFGTQGKKIPQEFVQEFQVKTGGYEAEYGKATGGIINVITKSGGNEFSGDVFAYSEGRAFKSGNRHTDDANLRQKPLLLENRTSEFGFDVGGPIIKDKLWFFAAYDRRTNSQESQVRVPGPDLGLKAPTDSTRDLYALKLTWRLAENQTLIASLLGDPEKVTGAVKDPQGPSTTWDGEHKIGGTDLSLRYELTGQSWFVQLQASQHEEKNSVLPTGAGATLIQTVDNTTQRNSGGFGRYDDKDFTRTNVSGSLTWYLGPHELKGGFDLQTDKATIHRGYSGGQQVTDYGNGTYSHYYWTIAGADVNNAPSIIFNASPKHESAGYFVQDKWSATPALTFNLGVRLDTTKIKDQHGATKIDLKDQWAPRLGVIWDWAGKGQDKVYMSLSRFYEQVPLDLVIRSFSDESNPTIFNFSPTSLVPDPAAGTSSIVGSYIEPVDPDLKGQYSDELILGAETTVASNYVLGAKYIRRYVGRAIEDSLDVNSPLGDYFIMNPGTSQTGKQYPRATRDYKGVEVSVQRKYADHYTWQASYLWSKLDGNYEGAYQGVGGPDGTGQLDPNINSAFDEPAFMVNSEGRLSGDRTHQVKANGYYEWDFGLSLGASFTYATGTPINRLGFADQVQPFPYTRYELFLTPRGSEGRTADTSRLDLNLGYTFKVVAKQQVRLSLDVTNVLNSQSATAVDQRYNFSGLDVGQTNPYFKAPTTFQAPRSVRFGVRYSF
ncbi:TonB-dependent receptor [Geothrix terrae]|uniref:TonB-dependent receptor n=1 Tax=Geothrix terrae TaxID=2922720 RepID=UPI001FAD4CB8|nr:TonB-dependent receptor [Geothrix terrae]